MAIVLIFLLKTLSVNNFIILNWIQWFLGSFWVIFWGYRCGVVRTIFWSVARGNFIKMRYCPFFRDYEIQCHLCFNWFLSSRPWIVLHSEVQVSIHIICMFIMLFFRFSIAGPIIVFFIRFWGTLQKLCFTYQNIYFMMSIDNLIAW